MEDHKILQLLYAGALADAAYYFGRHRIFEEVTRAKQVEQRHVAATQAAQLGISTIEGCYTRLGGLFGCADWKVSTEQDGTVVATSATCTLCAIAGRRGAPQPCYPFCINPTSAFAEALGYDLEVEETLWDGSGCTFVNRASRSSQQHDAPATPAR
jgi:hypothetical protein